MKILLDANISLLINIREKIVELENSNFGLLEIINKK